MVLVIEFLRSPPNTGVEHSETSLSGGHIASVAPPICQKDKLFSEPLPVSRPHKMSLQEEAKQLAAEFAYSSEDLNKGVKAFISQMRRWKWIHHS